MSSSAVAREDTRAPICICGNYVICEHLGFVNNEVIGKLLVILVHAVIITKFPHMRTRAPAKYGIMRGNKT